MSSYRSMLSARRLLTGALTGALLLGLAVAPDAQATAGAAAPPGSPVVPAVEAGWVTGVVVDIDGNPIKGDLVNALGPREVPEAGILADHTDRRDITDANGRFRVRQASPHGYLIQICDPEPSQPTACKETAQGVDHLITYVGPSGVTDSWVLQTSLFPPTGTDRALGTIAAKRQGFVEGTIGGAANTTIELRRLNETVAYRAFADGSGAYRFNGLAPGRYRVAAGGPDAGTLRWESDVISVRRDLITTVDGTLDDGATVHGAARSGGQPAAFLDLVVRTVGGSTVAATTTGADGSYRVRGLTPGDYVIGVPGPGGDYQRRLEPFHLEGAHSNVLRPLRLVRGAVVTADLRAGGQPATRASDELRDSTGRPILGQRNFDGTVTYSGLAPGRYTVVAANGTRYVQRGVVIGAARTYDLGTLRLLTPTLTLRGVTAPRAVVEAMTGDQCPADGPIRPGSFHEIEQADASGRYEIHGLPPGRYMLGSDGWPHNDVPRCVSGVEITHDTVRNLPLTVGSTVSGRLVYASGGPVITTLSYQLRYPPGSPTNPTDEHPSRGRTVQASGRFLIDRLAAGRVTGSLSQGADTENLTSQRFFVIFPYQDGTPYYLTTAKRSIQVPRAEDLDLGDISVILHR